MTAVTRNKVPVSLRLPRELVDVIDVYISENNLKKTDAYIHFLQQGVALEKQDASIEKIDSLHSKVDSIIQALSINSGICDSMESGAIKRIVADVAEMFPAIKKAYIFGSFARGTQNEESDIDIKLDIDREMPFRLNDLSHFMKLVEQQTGRECDVVTVENLKNKNLAESINRERVLIYERTAK